MSNPSPPSEPANPVAQSEEQTTVASEAYEAPQLQPWNEESEGDFWCD